MIHAEKQFKVDHKKGYIDSALTRKGNIWDIWEYGKKGQSSTYEGDRPHVIVQANAGSHSPVLMVAPISKQPRDDNYRFLQAVEVDYPSHIHYEHIKTVGRHQLIKHRGRLSLEERIEMDRVMAYPLDLQFSSVLSIEGVKVNNVFNHSRLGTVYRCKLLMIAENEKHFKFTRDEFIEYFGVDNIKYLNSDFLTLSTFLESMGGLKFVHRSIVRGPLPQ